LKAAILNNMWDGSIPDAYAMWEVLLQGQTGLRLLIQDSGQLSMILALERISTDPIDVVLQAMFSTGELTIKPVGVFISTYIIQNTVNQPLFGLGVQNASIAGFGTGGFGTETAGG
jgi:ethanolamine transporter EutH